MSQHLSFDAASHRYYLDGVEIPSVTQVIKSAGLSDYSHVPPDVLEAARELGKDVHLATELLDKRDLDEDSISDAVLPYLTAWRKFKEDFKPEIVLIESPLASERFRFAGTIDRYSLIDGKPCLIDIKTGVKEDWHKIQVAAYALLLKHNKKPAHHVIDVYLQDDGSYQVDKLRVVDLKVEESVFLSALNIMNYKKLKGKIQ